MHTIDIPSFDQSVPSARPDNKNARANIHTVPNRIALHVLLFTLHFKNLVKGFSD